MRINVIWHHHFRKRVHEHARSVKVLFDCLPLIVYVVAGRKIEKMTNVNKINQAQKIIMAEYMNENPNLAKNLLPNSCQGQAASIKMWDCLTRKLNIAGPPIKDVKSWKKVFADQKFQAKKKLSFNKASKNKTGGGPYEEKAISETELLVIEATGLEAAVQGLSNVKTFGGLQKLPVSETSSSTPQTHTASENLLEESFLLECDPTDSDDGNNKENEPSTSKMVTKRNQSNDCKVELLQENMRAGLQFNKIIEAKLDRLFDIQERTLVIKEEKLRSFLAVQQIELKIKTLQLENINNN